MADVVRIDAASNAADLGPPGAGGCRCRRRGEVTAVLAFILGRTYSRGGGVCRTVTADVGCWRERRP